jgi:hypothetical protein
MVPYFLFTGIRLDTHDVCDWVYEFGFVESIGFGFDDHGLGRMKGPLFPSGKGYI